ncbi:MAG: ABC transporter ATP-binding protein [Actinobacteria bacterium]|nr:MAG: ABC transporter ATP-binding protein [Actinomycetota bacterium]
MSEATGKSSRMSRRILRQIAPFWPQIALLLFVDLLATPLLLLTPVPLKIAVDSVIASHPLPGFVDGFLPASVVQSSVALLVVVAVLQVLVVLLSEVQSLVSYVLQTRTGERLTLEFRGRLFRHVQRLSLSFHDTRGSHDSIYRIQYDAEAMQHIVESMIPFVAAFAMLVSAIYVTARIDLQLALIALAVVPALFVLSRVYTRRVRRRYHDLKELESSALGVLQDVLTSVRVVKAFGKEKDEHARYVARSGKTVQARVRLSLTESAFGLAVNVAIAIGTAAVLFVGVRHVQSGVLTIGELLMVMTYLSQLYGPLETISQKVGDLQSSLASADRAFELLDETPDVEERPHARRIVRARGALEFRDVSFAYNGDGRVLHDVSFSLEPGTRLGIAGRTGAGKTTLVSLITRFYDPTAGAILLDGVDLRDYKLADLRNQFGIVLQEPVLFSTSIAENIAYARPGARWRDVIGAAEAANAHEFVRRLPDGYETVVGERGMRLSGGERQRIALARAFLKDAPILLLDEPTSSVDTQTEAAIMEAIQRLMEGRTSLLIAHRLSTLEICDARVEIESGRVVHASGAGLTSPAADFDAPQEAVASAG